MYLVYFALGLLLSNQLLSEKRISKKQEKESKKIRVGKTRKTYRTYIDNKSPDREIRPEDINISLNSQFKNIEQTREPNFIALTVLWSHFQALEENNLKANLPAPWEQYKEDKFISNKKSYLKKHKKWNRFLQEIISDKNWINWINNPREVRRRSIDAYRKVE